jgi:hypothetical protein
VSSLIFSRLEILQCPFSDEGQARKQQQQPKMQLNGTNAPLFVV